MSDLFHIQASRWKTIAGKHLETFSDAIEQFVRAAISHTSQESQIGSKFWDRSKLSLQDNKQAAEGELSRLCKDEKRQPITYNHYYSDNVQKARQDSTQKLIKETMNEASAEDWNGKLHISNNSVDAEKLVASLQSDEAWRLLDDLFDYLAYRLEVLLLQSSELVHTKMIPR